MSSAAILGITFAIVVLIVFTGVFMGKGHNRDLSGWLVHNRLMGPVLLWFLLGTEIYTAFTFEGLAGYAYKNGAAGFYNVASNDVAYAIGFLVLPAIWLLGKRFGFVTQSDFVAGRYQSRALGIFVAFTTALIMIAYIDLNITGLAAIFQVIGHGAISSTLASVIGFIVLALAVFFSGIRGNAIQSMIKDILMFVALAALFVVIPLRYFGSFGTMNARFLSEIPKYMVLPGASKHLGGLWLITTVALVGLGQWMWPQWFGTAFTAKNRRTMKLQAVFMPLYQLVKVAVITIGFAAVLVLGASKTINGNNVVMILALKSFPEWFVVLFSVAAMLSAIIPAGPIVMTSASLLSRNVWQELRPQTTAATAYTLTRALVFPLTLFALFLTLVAPALIVNILLVAYDFIAQLFPGIIIGGLFWRRATKEGMFAGLLTGWLVAGGLELTGHSLVAGVNAGFAALVANLIVFVAVSLVTKPVSSERLDQYFGVIFPKRSAVTSGVSVNEQTVLN